MGVDRVRLIDGAGGARVDTSGARATVILHRVVCGEIYVNDQLSDEEVRSHLPVQKIAVLADPPEATALSPRLIHYRS